MKNQIRSAVVAMSLVAGTTAVAGNHVENIQHDFRPASLAAVDGMQVVDPVELNTARAGWASLAFALGVASLDVALASFYWGIYVPYYTPQEPGFDMP